MTSSISIISNIDSSHGINLAMSLYNIPGEKEISDECNYSHKGDEPLKNTPRSESITESHNSGKQKEIHTAFADETDPCLREEKRITAIKSRSLEMNCLAPESSLPFSEKAELLIDEAGVLEGEHSECTRTTALKESAEDPVKCTKQENKQFQEPTHGQESIHITSNITATYECGSVQQKGDLFKNEEENVVPKVCKQRMKKRGKDSLRSLNTKAKMKKLPIKEMGILKQDEETILGGIFRLHVCNQQEGKRLEKIKKRKKCKVHKMPLSNAEEDDLPDEWFNRKVWNTLCHYPQLGSHAREEYYRRIIRWRKGFTSDVYKDECILCDIQQVTSKPLFKDIDTVNYSHDFYDRFSRQSRYNASSSTPIPEEELAFKYRSPPPVPPTSSLGSTPISPIPRLYSNIVSPCKITTPSPLDMLKAKSMINYVSNISPKHSPNCEYTESRAINLQELYVPRLKFIHEKCTPNIPPVRWAPERNPSRIDFLYRRNAFKAYLPKKETTSANRVKIPPIEKFAVKDLGVTYFLPDCNQNLAKRHVSIPQCYTYTPRSPWKKKETGSAPAWTPRTQQISII